MPQYQVYIRASFLFDMMIDAASWNDAALLALKRFTNKGGIQDRMIKAFAPGDYVDGGSKVESIYLVEPEE